MFLFKFPDVGEGIHEGTVVKVLVSEGQSVKADEPIFEVETDKAVVELPCPQAGIVLKIYVKQGDSIKVGQTIIAIGAAGEKAPDAPDQANATQPIPQVSKLPPSQHPVIAVQQTTAQAESAGVVKATPAVRALAQKLGVDLTQVKGSGPGGRIMPPDIENASKTASIPQPQTQAPVQTPTEEIKFAGPVDKIPLTGTRKAIVEKMTKWLSIPQAGVSEDFDLTALYEWREQNKRAGGKPPTYLAFIVKAIAVVLPKHPLLNATFLAASNEIALKKYYNIGIAVDTENGLLVPVVKNADTLKITEIAERIETLANAAREHKSNLSDLKDSTFTITNVGSLGGVAVGPVINYPESAILGLSKLRDTPAVYQGRIVARKIMRFDLGFDHRVLDGADGMRFLIDLKELLENPEKLEQYL